ncbi:MAG: histidine phosphatase family protein [Bacteroidales bacterium]|nr:histidine phosphatase family protein [Bacteroidales bacterium]
MKTLYLVRHAKSSWKDPELSDLERPLLEKGLKRTKLVIDELLKKKVRVDLIVSSHAVRAFETAKILAKALDYPPEDIRIEKQIYHTDADSLFHQFYDLPEESKSMMLVGHNPTITNFANKFLTNKLDSLPTSGVVCIEFDTDEWEGIIDAKNKPIFVINPKKIKKKKGS